MNVYAHGYLKEAFEEFCRDHVVVCRFRQTDLLPILGQLLLFIMSYRVTDSCQICGNSFLFYEQIESAEKQPLYVSG